MSLCDSFVPEKAHLYDTHVRSVPALVVRVASDGICTQCLLPASSTSIKTKQNERVKDTLRKYCLDAAPMYIRLKYFASRGPAGVSTTGFKDTLTPVLYLLETVKVGLSELLQSALVPRQTATSGLNGQRYPVFSRPMDTGLSQMCHLR